jgi:CHASE2 domain-containing sensor protein
MKRGIWKKIKKQVSIWRVWTLPGMTIIGLVIAARLTGSLQGLEWDAFDTFLRLRPREPQDDRIVLIGIDEADIQRIGYPIPSQKLVDLIDIIQTYEPTAIGVNILWNPSVALNMNSPSKIEYHKNVIVVEQALLEQTPPPPGFPPEQVGFADIHADGDNKLRRVLLGMPSPINPKEYKFSLAIRLAESYFRSRSITLENGIHDSEAMRFASTELPRFTSNSGGYVGADAGGVQILLNWRNNQKPFRVLSLKDIEAGNFNPNWLRNRIVIVGITDPRIRGTFSSSAIANSNFQSKKIYGLEVQAHAVSQIISAVLNKRHLLKSWSETWEYLWIFCWGCVGISFGWYSGSTSEKLIKVGIAQIFLMGYCYVVMTLGFWIPFTPAALVLILNGIGYAAFYKYDRVLKAKLYENQRTIDKNQRVINERQRTIEHTFDIIHNGPLQTLANLLRQARDEELSENFVSELEDLNFEIREIGEYLKQEALTQKGSFYLKNGVLLDSKLPIHELFYEIYSKTLERDFSGFRTLKVKVRSFEPVDEQYISIEEKQSLCRWLEESLCNVGKHAEGVTHLVGIGINRWGWYTLRISNNGYVPLSNRIGRGTEQAIRLAAQLNGKFKREHFSPQETLCELTWPITKSQSAYLNFWD